MPAAPSHILVHLPNWLGDCAMATPALRALRADFPAAHITWAGRGLCIDLLEGLPWCDAVLPFAARSSLAAMRKAARHLKRAPDVGIAFPHSARATLFLWLCGCHQRIGYDRGSRRFLLTHPIPPYREEGRIAPRYMAAEYLELLKPLGVQPDGLGLELHADPEIVAKWRPRLDPARPAIGIAPGAAFGPSKQWPAERFAEVANLLHEQHHAQIVLFTGPGEENVRDLVTALVKQPLIQASEVAGGIAGLKAGIAAMDVLIGNDSAPRHIAIAFGIPIVCIMGPTSPRYTQGPWEKGDVLRVDVDCGPCQKPVCATDHRCMTGITPQAVVQAASRSLANRV